MVARTQAEALEKGDHILALISDKKWKKEKIVSPILRCFMTFENKQMKQ